MTCLKRPYPSAQACRRANYHARFRVRAYLCERCWKWHATNQEKR